MSEFVKRIQEINSKNVDFPLQVLSTTKDLLISLNPWLRSLDLSYTVSKNVASLEYLKGCWIYPPLSISRPAFHATISKNMIFLTERFGDSLESQIESIWLSLVGFNTRVDGRHHKRTESNTARNINIILEFLLEYGVERKNPNIIKISRRIISCIRDNHLQTMDCLISMISPSSLVPPSSSVSPTPPISRIPNIPGQLFTIDLDDVLPSIRDSLVLFSKGQLAVTFFADLVIEVHVDSLIQHIPLLLHAIFVQLDHSMILICEQNRILLVNLIRASIPRDAVGAVDLVLESLDLMKGMRAWSYEDITSDIREIQSSLELGDLCRDIVELFSIVDQSIAQSWGEIALEWSTECPLRHIACRSLQIFRYFDSHNT
jgi:hypothetical protein